jgi:CheY-like chemotaxis protein
LHENAGHHAGASSASGEFISQPLILVVDDDPTSLKLTSLMLETEGFVCVTAHGGVSLFEALKTHRPALILMDIHLRDPLDGFALTTRLTRNAATRDIPVVIYSASHVPTDAANALAAGAVAYIARPTHASVLCAMVRKHMKTGSV